MDEGNRAITFLFLFCVRKDAAISSEFQFTFQVWAVLLSDILLLTKEDDDRLIVVMEPIALEFVLSVDSSTIRKCIFHPVSTET